MGTDTTTVTTTPATILRHAVELAEPGPAGETRWDEQARTLGELGYAIVGKDDVAELKRLRARVAVLEAGETRTEWGVQFSDATPISSYGDHEGAAREYVSFEGDRLVRREVRTGPWVPVEDEAGER